MNRTFGVIGGDRRQAELARLLAADGHTVFTYGLERWGCEEMDLEAAAECETVLLPLPLCVEEGVLHGEKPLFTAEVFRRLRPQQRILAGQVKPGQRREAAEYGLTLEDYFLREELVVANAAITAECAVQTAMEYLDRTLLGMDCLVLGFGCIGQFLCQRLHGMGARVTAAARRPEALARIAGCGWQAEHIGALSGKLSRFGVVFNTAPSPILDAALLAQLPGGCLCVELASAQGIDLAAARELGLPNVWARALPGRLRPKSAAAAIRDAVYYILKEERGEPA